MCWKRNYVQQYLAYTKEWGKGFTSRSVQFYIVGDGQFWEKTFKISYGLTQKHLDIVQKLTMRKQSWWEIVRNLWGHQLQSVVSRWRQGNNSNSLIQSPTKIVKWTGKRFIQTQALANDRIKWKLFLEQATIQRPYDLGGLWDKRKGRMVWLRQYWSSRALHR